MYDATKARETFCTALQAHEARRTTLRTSNFMMEIPTSIIMYLYSTSPTAPMSSWSITKYLTSFKGTPGVEPILSACHTIVLPICLKFGLDGSGLRPQPDDFDLKTDDAEFGFNNLRC